MNKDYQSEEKCSRRAFLGAVATGTGSVMLGGCGSINKVAPEYRKAGGLVGTASSDTDKSTTMTIEPPPTYPAGTPVEVTVKRDFEYFIYEIKRLLESGHTENQVREQWVNQYPHEVTLDDGSRRLLGIIDAQFDAIHKGTRIVGFKVCGCMLRGGGDPIPTNTAYDRPLWQEGMNCELASAIADETEPIPPPYGETELSDDFDHHVVSSSSSSSSSW